MIIPVSLVWHLASCRAIKRRPSKAEVDEQENGLKSFQTRWFKPASKANKTEFCMRRMDVLKRAETLECAITCERRVCQYTLLKMKLASPENKVIHDPLT